MPEKGFTNSAIGVVIARIVKGILEDEKSVMPVSVYWDGEYVIQEVCMSLPGVIGLESVKNRMVPDLNDEEIAGLKNSAGILTESLEGIELE